jgi:hypothetical protein
MSKRTSTPLGVPKEVGGDAAAASGTETEVGVGVGSPMLIETEIGIGIEGTAPAVIG